MAQSNAPQREILLISTFPPQKAEHLKETGGLARFMKIITDNTSSVHFTILSERFSDKDIPFQEASGHTVIPTWKRGSLGGMLAITAEILQRSYAGIMINHDFGVFGNMMTTLLFPLVMLVARLKTNKIVTIQHSGLTDLRLMSGHLQMKEDDWRLWLYSLGIKVELIWFLWLSKVLVVTEEEIKSRLSSLPLITKEKIVVIPLPIFAKKTAKQNKKGTTPIQKAKSLFNILFFGFLTWYKGADWIVKSAKLPGWPSDIRLIMAGGQTINQPNSSYYTKLVEEMKTSPHIKHTGFVPEERVADYFMNADLIVLPYRVMMAASGPLASAIGYGKPFLISEPLTPYATTSDFAEAMKALKLEISDISFSLKSKKSFIKRIKDLRKNSDELMKITQLSLKLQSSRAKKTVTHQYDELVLRTINHE